MNAPQYRTCVLLSKRPRIYTEFKPVKNILSFYRVNFGLNTCFQVPNQWSNTLWLETIRLYIRKSIFSALSCSSAHSFLVSHLTRPNWANFELELWSIYRCEKICYKTLRLASGIPDRWNANLLVKNVFEAILLWYLTSSVQSFVQENINLLEAPLLILLSLAISPDRIEPILS